MQNHITRRTTLAGLAAASLAGTAHAAASADKIIITGASGQLGTLTIKALLARGVPAANLILVSRTPATLAEYAKMGAVTRAGDFTKPETLPAAFAGGTRMFLISISGVSPRPPYHKNAIDAAAKAGVKQIAYSSWIGLAKDDFTGLGVDHGQTEAFLRESGVPWTALRNSIYMENVLGPAAKMAASGTATMPANESPIGYVTREDCAAAAAGALTTPGHDNKAYAITGPELVGTKELAAAVTAVTGKPVTVTVDANAKDRFNPSVSIVTSSTADLKGAPATSVRQLLAANKDKLTPDSRTRSGLAMERRTI